MFLRPSMLIQRLHPNITSSCRSGLGVLRLPVVSALTHCSRSVICQRQQPLSTGRRSPQYSSPNSPDWSKYAIASMAALTTLILIQPIFFTILGLGSAAFVFQWTLRRLTGTPMSSNWFPSSRQFGSFASSTSGFWSNFKDQFNARGMQDAWLSDHQVRAMDLIRQSSFGFLRSAKVLSDPLIITDSTSLSGSPPNRKRERQVLFKFEILVQQGQVHDVWGSLVKNDDQGDWEWERLWVQEVNNGDAIWEIPTV
jgi:hypothetical protein